MTRLNLLLLIALIVSSLYLVKVSYDSRSYFVALERAQSESRKLDTDYKRLDAERQGQATHVRVEQVARNRLGMRTATPGVTQYVTDAATPAHGNAGPSGAAR